MDRQIKFKLLGMDTDSDASIIDGTSSIENYNVRFTVTEKGQADAAITNEAGTKLITSIRVLGAPIGYCTLSDYVVIFCTLSEGNDRIYIYKHENNDFTLYWEYRGDFNFDVKNPIECQSVWEREDLLKVFWIDGRNPLRFMTFPKKKSEEPIIVKSKSFITSK